MQTKIDPRSLGRVVVLMGGMSSEREVSLSSGAGVLKALKDRGVEAEAFDPAEKKLSELEAGHYDRAFIALHGRFGEDGTIQGVLEYLGLPYTGPGVQASAVAIDKSATRIVWQAAGLPVAEGLTVTSADEAGRVARELGSSVVVKPDNEGSSIGVTKLKDATEADIRAALETALKLDRRVLVEKRVFGREFTVAILNGKAQAGDYDYRNKYFGNAVKYDCPAQLTEEKTREIQAACEAAFAALGARGWGRIDVMMDDDGDFVLLELNTSPGMTPHSLVPMAARAAGMSYEDLVLFVASTAALDRKVTR